MSAKGHLLLLAHISQSELEPVHRPTSNTQYKWVHFRHMALICHPLFLKIYLNLPSAMEHIYIYIMSWQFIMWEFQFIELWQMGANKKSSTG